jgi:hypothetical protein
LMLEQHQAVCHPHCRITDWPIFLDRLDLLGGSQLYLHVLTDPV